MQSGFCFASSLKSNFWIPGTLGSFLLLKRAGETSRDLIKQILT